MIDVDRHARGCQTKGTMTRIAFAGFGPWFVALSLVTSSQLRSSLASAQECQTDDDCGPAFRCGFSGEGSDSASVDCKGDCAPVEVEAPLGQCEQDGIACSSDADCPEPASCEDDECVYRLVDCASDAECGANYVCTAMDSGRCSSSPDPGPGASAEGSGGTDVPGITPTPQSGSGGDSSSGAGDAPVTPADDAPVPTTEASEPAEPDAAVTPSAPKPLDPDAPEPGTPVAPDAPGSVIECESAEVKACFPKPVACSTDDDCNDAWKCTDIPAGGPDSWEDIQRACLPPGVAAAIDGTIKFEGTGTGTSVGEDGAGNPVRGDDNQLPTPMPLPGEDPNPNLGTQGGSEGAAGCGVANGTQTGSGFLLWATSALALVGWKRRRQG
jgi:hypothetical protein